MKRARYFSGRLLSADDLATDQSYMLGRDNHHQRLLHGYGTVVGLAVSADSSTLKVSPGVAIDPLGHEICVGAEQDLDLGVWADDPPATAWLVVRYREVPTDEVPTLTGDVVASRVADGFELAVRLAPPDCAELEAIRRFVAWWHALPISDGTGSSVDAVVAGLRDASDLIATGAGNATAGKLDLPRTSAAHLQAALRIWVTEIRPRVFASDPVEPDVLLAKIVVRPGGGRAVEVDESRRPILVASHLVELPPVA